MVSFAEGNRRLLALAKILQRVPRARRIGPSKIKGYDQERVTHPCGSPACAWGYWIYGNKERFKRIAAEEGYDKYTIDRAIENWTNVNKLYIAYTGGGESEFGLSASESDELFESSGCGGAKTGAQAAKHIRSFVARRRKAARGDHVET